MPNDRAQCMANHPAGKGRVRMRDIDRECNQCGTVYVARNGVGGSLARERDRDLFPFDESTVTGVRADNDHWLHGAFCSDECYSFAYSEPPSNY